MYIYICVCVYIYIYTYVYVYMYICVCARVCVRASACVCVRLRAFACVRVRVCARARVCVCVLTLSFPCSSRRGPRLPLSADGRRHSFSSRSVGLFSHFSEQVRIAMCTVSTPFFSVHVNNSTKRDTLFVRLFLGEVLGFLSQQMSVDTPLVAVQILLLFNEQPRLPVRTTQPT